MNPWTELEGSRRLRFSSSWQLTHEGGKVLSPKHLPPLPPENIPGTHCRSRLSRLQGHSAARRMSVKNSNWIRDLLACSIVPQPTAPPRARNRPKITAKITSSNPYAAGVMATTDRHAGTYLYCACVCVCIQHQHTSTPGAVAVP